MTLTKDISAKFAVAIVAVAIALMSFASSASAQTSEDLQQMINDLLAQVASLQSQLGQGAAPAAAGVCPYTWTRDLSSGSEGMDVMKLQQFLNADPDTRVAVSGAGSAGMETEYYGPATAAAVSKLQVKYRSEVLSPANLVNPTGYFGPGTRAKANGLCVAAPVVDDSSDDSADDSSDDSADDSSDDSDMTLGGEASLNKMEIDSADDDQIEEGTDDAVIAEVTLEFADGDAEISRIDITVDEAGAGADVWDVLDTLSLWVDGDMIAEKSANDKDDYLDTTGTAGTMRFSGLDLVAMEDEEVVVTIAASIQRVDSADEGDFEVQVDALRFFDADGVASTENAGMDFGTAVGFSVEAAGYADELIVKTSANDPNAATLQVQSDAKSDWYTVFAFDLDTDNSENDIELTTIPVDVTVSSSTFDGLVADFELVIDGVSIDNATYTDGATVTLLFDVNGEVVIDAGDRIEAELNLRFRSLAAGDEGVTVQAEVNDADSIAAEGADDLGATQLSGSATGDAHTLRTAGVDVTMTDDSAVATAVDGSNDYATYVIEIEVTAFEQDVFLSTDPATSTVWSLETSSGGSVPAGTTTVVLESTGDENGGYFEIPEGSTETLTLTVTYTPGSQTSARLLLESLEFAATASAPDQSQSTLPETDFRTSVVTIQD